MVLLQPNTMWENCSPSPVPASKGQVGPEVPLAWLEQDASNSSPPLFPVVSGKASWELGTRWPDPRLASPVNGNDPISLSLPEAGGVQGALAESQNFQSFDQLLQSNASGGHLGGSNGVPLSLTAWLSPVKSLDSYPHQTIKSSAPSHSQEWGQRRPATAQSFYLRTFNQVSCHFKTWKVTSHQEPRRFQTIKRQ